MINQVSSEPPAATTPGAFRAREREASLRAKTRGSLERYRESCKVMAGGVSSHVRRKARPYPLFFRSGSGAWLNDVDGNAFLDYALGWGPNILGNAPPRVAAAIREQARRGLTFGAQHDLEIEVSRRLNELIPCSDLVVYSNSGTEIVQLALRVARAATGRTLFVKFEGHYHGWHDTVLASYHPTLEEIERSAGKPVGAGKGQLPPEQAVVAQWNDEESVRAAFSRNAGRIAAVLCEPLMCNSGCIPPEAGFLEFLREISLREGALLIFDEVITGFRLDLHGAQGFYGVIPDLATYAKAVGAGTPLSVLAGKAEYMELIARGEVIHAGSLNGNPLSLAAAKAALEELAADGGAVYRKMHQLGNRLRKGLERILRDAGHSVVTCGEGPVFQLLFMNRAPRNYRELLEADEGLSSDFALALLDEGVLVLPDGRWYLSTAHGPEHIEQTLAAAERAAA